ncbi:uncharacterized protein [Prorops nasuta]|uniref:uncharacterized protein n=1 Tax=Prorops nasuta TaxID=863751 RepID=UPI0034CE9513
MGDASCGRSILDQLFDNFLELSSTFSNGRVKICPAKDVTEEDIVAAEAELKPEEIPEEKVEETVSKPKKGPCPICPYSCPKPKPYISPEEICPSITIPPTCCFIKMQDPCAPCCCDTRPPPKICPPKKYPLPKRKPTCECDYCKQGHASPKCCDNSRS